MTANFRSPGPDGNSTGAANTGNAAKPPSSMINLVLISLFLGLCWWLIKSSNNDIAGEYSYYDRSAGNVYLSIERKDGNLLCRLTYGPSGTDMCTVSDTKIGKKINWTFHKMELPIGAAGSYVSFKGSSEPGIISGIIEDGLSIYTVNLKRNWTASIYRGLCHLIPGA